MSQLQPVLTFDGIDDYIDISYSEKITSNIFTLSCWAKYTNISLGEGDGILNVTYGSRQAGSGYVLAMLPTHQWGLTFTASSAIKSPSAVLNTWTHIAATYDGSNAKLYINGKVAGEGIISFNTGYNQVLVRMGAGYSVGANLPYYFFTGQIAEVCFWNKARTQQEIQSDMNKRLTGKEAGLVGYWPLNEGSGNTAIDETGNGKNGIIKGATWTMEEIPLNPAVPTTGEFQVSSNSETGFEFTNSQTKDISYKFTPSGTWKPKSNFEDFTAAGVKGLPPGHQEPYLKELKPYQQYLKYQNNTFFCLVAVNKTTGVVTEVGQETTIVLKPGETLTFVVNDLTIDYTDNTGTLTVKWSAT